MLHQIHFTEPYWVNTAWKGSNNDAALCCVFYFFLNISGISPPVHRMCNESLMCWDSDCEIPNIPGHHKLTDTTDSWREQNIVILVRISLMKNIQPRLENMWQPYIIYIYIYIYFKLQICNYCKHACSCKLKWTLMAVNHQQPLSLVIKIITWAYYQFIDLF